jgi:hypothetical protein
LAPSTGPTHAESFSTLLDPSFPGEIPRDLLIFGSVDR